MKKVFLFVLALLFSMAISAQEFKFEKETINYGKIKKNADGKRIFKFTNIGDSPIIIKEIKTSCDCTVPEKPKKPIMPGEEATITVSYDTATVGGFSKEIIIFSNAKTSPKKIKIKGFIID